MNAPEREEDRDQREIHLRPGLRLRELEHRVPLGAGVTGVIDSRLPRWSVEHVRERRGRAHLGERHEPRLLDELDVDAHPARIFARRLGVVVVALRVELRRVGVRGRRRPRDAGDAGLGAARVVEEREVADRIASRMKLRAV